MMLAGYATVRNPCSKPVVIVGVESIDFAEAMIHQTLVEGDVSKMRHVGRLVLDAGGELRFAPGGLHLMLMRPMGKLPEGSRARIRLLLADGGKLFAEYPVQRQAPLVAVCNLPPGAVSTKPRRIDAVIVARLKPGASIRDAIALFGPAARDVGSGVHVMEWDISRKDVFRLSAADFCAPSLAQGQARR